MNIFIIDTDPVLSVQYHADKHVLSQVRETAQMLSFVLRRYFELLPEFVMADSERHQRHPCTNWVGANRSNFSWTVRFGQLLYNEYIHRWSNPKGHLRSRKIFEYCDWLKNTLPIPEGHQTPFAQAMDEKYQHDHAVVAYRRYYLAEKRHLFKWKNRFVPAWIENQTQYFEI